MALPDYQSLMLPLMCLVRDQKEPILAREAVALLGKRLDLTSDELAELLPSGGTFTFASRVSWAATYLKKAGLLSAPKRGFYAITQRGLELLASNPNTINVTTLRKYPEFLVFHTGKSPKTDTGIRESAVNESTDTPAEALENAYRSLRETLADELLDKLKQTDPAFFERIVVELLVKMGYGGSLADAGKAVGRSGDGGIDGIIKEDKLGLDVIYVQAKGGAAMRWGVQTSNNSPEHSKASALPRASSSPPHASLTRQ